MFYKKARSLTERRMLIFALVYAVGIGLLHANDASAHAPNEGWLAEGPPFQHVALDWQEAIEAERIVIPPPACMDLFERGDALFDDIIASTDYQNAFRSLQSSDLPALVRLMGRSGCAPQLRSTPAEGIFCRRLRQDARYQLQIFSADPDIKRFLNGRLSRAYLALIAQTRALGCFEQDADTAS